MIVNPLCPNCGAALPPRGDARLYICSFCERTFETDAPAAVRSPALADRTATPEFPRLCADAERLIVDVERANAELAKEATALGGTAALLQGAATKKLHQRVEAARKAIAEKDETMLREHIDKLTALQELNASYPRA